MRSAVTISLTPEARGGPFVFWDSLEDACAAAARLGFDAVEIFAPRPIDANAVSAILEKHRLSLAGVGTGAGMVVHKLSLTSADANTRVRAREFVRGIIEAGAKLGAPAIVGSMQGRWSDAVPRDDAFEYLIDALNDLGEYAAAQGVPLIYEPLNRYETNLVTTQAEGVALLNRLKSDNVNLLADLFHMNIEEADLPAAIRASAGAIGHVHLADSNRRPAGCGHTDFAAIAAALRDIGYDGYVSAECLPWPDPDAAAAKTIEAYRRDFGRQ